MYAEQWASGLRLPGPISQFCLHLLLFQTLSSLLDTTVRHSPHHLLTGMSEGHAPATALSLGHVTASIVKDNFALDEATCMALHRMLTDH